MILDVLITCFEADAYEARRVTRLLERMNIRYHVDMKRRPLDVNISIGFRQQLKQCRLLFVIISPASLASDWIAFEVGAANALGKEVLAYATLPRLRAPTYLSDVPVISNIEDLPRYFSPDSPAGSDISHLFDTDLTPDEQIVHDDSGFVLTVGGANGEYTLKLSSELVYGQKHEVISHSLLGGSGLNYTLRLLNAGIPALPILAIGDDDLGRKIQCDILQAAKKTEFADEITAFVDDDAFFVRGMPTPLSTIIVSGANRTTFKERVQGSERFFDFMRSRVERMSPDLSDRIRVVMIGHIDADRIAADRGSWGQCTKLLVNRFSDSVPVFANFGESQIKLGYDFWSKAIERFNVFQLNLNEIKRFFLNDDAVPNLTQVVEDLIEKPITAVITLDEFGAVCTHKESADTVILAWPFTLGNVVDATGAGDAFGAGIVSALFQNADLSLGGLFNAIQNARVWAAYACTCLGGAANCPDANELDSFHNKLVQNWQGGMEIKSRDNAKEILGILDKAANRRPPWSENIFSIKPRK